jgi:hypothetical protein
MVSISPESMHGQSPNMCSMQRRERERQHLSGALAHHTKYKKEKSVRFEADLIVHDETSPLH